MAATAAQVNAQRLPSTALRRFAWAVLGYFVTTILWGAIVRATGSGAGCGNHWPLCNGTVLQQSPTMETIIEFTHRVTAALDLILIVGLLVWAWRKTVRGHLARWAAGAALFLTLTEGLLGALLVKLGLTAGSKSPLRPPFEALHFSNTLLLVAALTMSAHFLGRRAGFRWRDIRINAPVATTVGMIAVMIVGVTGSMAALGDTLFPATSLNSALAQDFSSTSSWLVRWRWTHPTVAVLASVFLIWILVRATKRTAERTAHWDNRGLSVLMLALLAVQYVLGVLDVVLLAPVWMQVAHLLGADVLWAALVVLTARLTLEPKEAERDFLPKAAYRAPNKVYFDTDSFRAVGRALEGEVLPDDIRDAIVVSPLSALEVMSQLTTVDADEVLREIRAMRSWLRPLDAEILPWPDDVLAKLGFGKTLETIDVARIIGTALRNCLGATAASQLQSAAGELKDFLDKAKYGTAQTFDQALASAGAEPLDEALFRGTAQRVGAKPEPKAAAAFAENFSAYHEFEKGKLQAALNSRNYNAMKHRNDLIDAEQLVYLAIPGLHFITCDTGFRRVEGSAQASRIFIVPRDQVSNLRDIETLLRKIIGIPGTQHTQFETLGSPEHAVGR